MKIGSARDYDGYKVRIETYDGRVYIGQAMYMDEDGIDYIDLYDGGYQCSIKWSNIADIKKI